MPHMDILHHPTLDVSYKNTDRFMFRKLPLVEVMFN